MVCDYGSDNIMSVRFEHTGINYNVYIEIPETAELKTQTFLWKDELFHLYRAFRDEEPIFVLHVNHSSMRVECPQVLCGGMDNAELARFLFNKGVEQKPTVVLELMHDNYLSGVREGRNQIREEFRKLIGASAQ